MAQRSKAQRAVAISPRLPSTQKLGFLTPQSSLISKMNDQFPETPKRLDIFVPRFVSQSSQSLCLGLLGTSGQNQPDPGQGIPGIQQGQDVGQRYQQI